MRCDNKGDHPVRGAVNAPLPATISCVVFDCSFSVARGRLNGPCLDNGVCVIANSVCNNGQCVCSDDTFNNEGFCGKYLTSL